MVGRCTTSQPDWQRRDAGMSLDSQALAAFGATCIDDGTATTRFHAYEKTVSTLAAGY